MRLKENAEFGESKMDIVNRMITNKDLTGLGHHYYHGDEELRNYIEQNTTEKLGQVAFIRVRNNADRLANPDKYKLEEELDETTSAGSAGAYVGAVGMARRKNQEYLFENNNKGIPKSILRKIKGVDELINSVRDPHTGELVGGTEEGFEYDEQHFTIEIIGDVVKVSTIINGKSAIDNFYDFSTNDEEDYEYRTWELNEELKHIVKLYKKAQRILNKQDGYQYKEDFKDSKKDLDEKDSGKRHKDKDESKIAVIQFTNFEEKIDMNQPWFKMEDMYDFIAKDNDVVKVDFYEGGELTSTLTRDELLAGVSEGVEKSDVTVMEMFDILEKCYEEHGEDSELFKELESKMSECLDVDNPDGLIDNDVLLEINNIIEKYYGEDNVELLDENDNTEIIDKVYIQRKDGWQDSIEIYKDKDSIVIWHIIDGDDVKINEFNIDEDLNVIYDYIYNYIENHYDKYEIIPSENNDDSLDELDKATYTSKESTNSEVFLSEDKDLKVKDSNEEKIKRENSKNANKINVMDMVAEKQKDDHIPKKVVDNVEPQQEFLDSLRMGMEDLEYDLINKDTEKRHEEQIDQPTDSVATEDQFGHKTPKMEKGNIVKSDVASKINKEVKKKNKQPKPPLYIKEPQPVKIIKENDEIVEQGKNYAITKTEKILIDEQARKMKKLMSYKTRKY